MGDCIHFNEEVQEPIKAVGKTVIKSRLMNYGPMAKWVTGPVTMRGASLSPKSD